MKLFSLEPTPPRAYFGISTYRRLLLEFHPLRVSSYKYALNQIYVLQVFLQTHLNQKNIKLQGIQTFHATLEPPTAKDPILQSVR